jgi:hypothetical protein
MAPQAFPELELTRYAFSIALAGNVGGVSDETRADIANLVLEFFSVCGRGSVFTFTVSRTTRRLGDYTSVMSYDAFCLAAAQYIFDRNPDMLSCITSMEYMFRNVYGGYGITVVQGDPTAEAEGDEATDMFEELSSRVVSEADEDEGVEEVAGIFTKIEAGRKAVGERRVRKKPKHARPVATDNPGEDQVAPTTKLQPRAKSDEEDMEVHKPLKRLTKPKEMSEDEDEEILRKPSARRRRVLDSDDDD